MISIILYLINGISAAIFDHELLEAQRGVQFIRGRLSGICEEVFFFVKYFY